MNHLLRRWLFQTIAVMAFAMPAFTAKAELLTGNTLFNFAPNPSVSLDLLLVNTTSNLVDIYMSGRNDGWFAIGFGNNTMDDTYAIIIDQAGASSEYKLGPFGANTLIASTVSLVSSNVVGSTRTVHLQRSRDLGVGFPDHYVYPTTPGTVLLAGATGPGAFGYHLSRNGGSVQLSAIPEPASTSLILAGGMIALVSRRRSRR
jgi:hypothetical protein